MKKILLLFILVSITLLASPQDTEKKIYKTILSSIFPKKSTILVWSDNPQKQKILSEIKNVKIADSEEDADILIINKSYDINATNKKIFADGYLVFKHYKDDIIGGFYWQKGRPNLIFLKKNLIDHNISLPNTLKNYIEDYD